MHKLSRREALRGTGVAALAAAGVAALPFVANASNDPLLGCPTASGGPGIGA